MPSLYGDIQLGNAATAIMAMAYMDRQLPVTQDSVDRGLANIKLPGRFQRIQGPCEIILDVAHNLDSAEVLVENLRALAPVPKTIAVFAVLADKDVCGIIECVGGQIDEWHISQLQSERALSKENLKIQLENCCHDCVIHMHNSILKPTIWQKAT